MRAAALPADEVAHSTLERKLTGLKLPPESGSATSSVAGVLIGKKYVFPDNEAALESIELESADKDRVVFKLKGRGAAQRMECPYDRWWKGELAIGGTPNQLSAVSGAWLEKDVYGITIFFYETPHSLSLKLHFDGDQLFLDAESNVAFGPTRKPQLVGKAE